MNLLPKDNVENNTASQLRLRVCLWWCLTMQIEPHTCHLTCWVPFRTSTRAVNTR
jgi:hypothetical protein